MAPLNLSSYAVSKALGVPRTRIERLARERAADEAQGLRRFYERVGPIVREADIFAGHRACAGFYSISQRGGGSAGALDDVACALMCAQAHLRNELNGKNRQ